MNVLLVTTLLVICLLKISNSFKVISSRRLLSQSRKVQFKDAVSISDYVFVPPEVSADIYVGSIVSLIPIVWATYEFNNRIQTQRQCLLCQGSGLVYTTKAGNSLSRPRKCWSCGGFLPWLGWKMFFFSTFFDVGNGGVLQRPAPDFEQTNELVRKGLIARDGAPVKENEGQVQTESDDNLSSLKP